MTQDRILKQVGKVKEAHGLKGELYVLLFTPERDWLEEVERFFLGANGTEYLCERVKPHKQGLILKLEGVADRTAAEALKGASVSVEDDLFVSEPGEQIYLSEILHFELCDPEGKNRGRICGFSSNGVQDLLKVETEKGVFEVPFVDAFLQEIDFEAKKVLMDLPVGLLGEDLD